MKNINPPISKIVIYTKDVEKMTDFYVKHFGFKSHQEEGDRIVELISPNGGLSLMLHKAAKTAKEGQNCVKLVFDVKDVETFKATCAMNGLKFGPIHMANGYVYSNAKDPSKNSIQISSRAFRNQSA